MNGIDTDMVILDSIRVMAQTTVSQAELETEPGLYAVIKAHLIATAEEKAQEAYPGRKLHLVHGEPEIRESIVGGRAAMMVTKVYSTE